MLFAGRRPRRGVIVDAAKGVELLEFVVVDLGRVDCRSIEAEGRVALLLQTRFLLTGGRVDNVVIEKQSEIEMFWFEVVGGKHASSKWVY